MNNNTKMALVIGGMVLAFFAVVPFIWGGRSGWNGGWGMMGPGMMGWGWFMMIPFWVLLIWGVTALVGGAGRPYGPDLDSSHPESALDVLKKRYARGEIGKEEYEEKRRDLA